MAGDLSCAQLQSPLLPMSLCLAYSKQATKKDLDSLSYARPFFCAAKPAKVVSLNSKRHTGRRQVQQSSHSDSNVDEFVIVPCIS